MDGTKAIINKILDDARIEQNEILDNARAICDNKIAEANEFSVEYEKAQTEILEKEISAIISGKVLNAELDVKKAILQGKRNLIDEVFDGVKAKLSKLDKKTYCDFVNKLIAENADLSDEIILSCDNVLKDSDISESVIKDKKLKISSKRGDFKGGVYLIGNTSDKDLTFDAIVENRKEELVSIASKILFKD